MDHSDANATPPTPVIPGFRVGQLLGEGGSGRVWAVARESDSVRFAAKVLHDRAEDVGLELSVLQRLDHEHVLRLQDTVLVESGPYPQIALITELAEGGSFGAAIAGRGHLTVGELVTVLCPVARALHDLHSLGLVHGDLSPANVLLTDDGRPLIADLGVARLAGVPDAEVWGTDGYVAPEVLGGALPDPAADVYALGALAWTALVGRAPEPAALRPHLEDVAPQVPAPVRDLVTSCLAHTPQARPEPGDLALRLWDLAAPEPAPVAGSAGRRTAAIDDPAAGLTQRIRERATPVEPPSPLPWWRQRVVRRTSIAAAVLGSACAGYAALGAPATGAGPAPAVSVSSSSAAPATLRTPSSTTPSSTTPSGTMTSKSAGETTRATPRPSTPSSPSGSGSPRVASPEGLGAEPVGLVQELVAARARAWTTGSDRDLAAAFVPKSTAWTRDAADLRQAAARSARYTGLHFTVRQVSLRFETDYVVADAVIDRSAYTLVEPSGRTPVAASAGERATIRLDWTKDGWRISNWTPRAQ